MRQLILSWIAKFTGGLVSEARCFRHVEGFAGSDGTDYIKIVDGVTFLVMRDGRVKKDKYYSLAVCLRHVANGNWYEFKTLSWRLKW